MKIVQTFAVRAACVLVLIVIYNIQYDIQFIHWINSTFHGYTKVFCWGGGNVYVYNQNWAGALLTTISFIHYKWSIHLTPKAVFEWWNLSRIQQNIKQVSSMMSQQFHYSSVGGKTIDLNWKIGFKLSQKLWYFVLFLSIGI